VRVSETEGFTFTATEIVIDISNTVFKDGTANDLRVNTFVEVEGYWDGVSFTSRKVEFD
jgi:predicted Zn-dependent protease with MMP-like domain